MSAQMILDEEEQRCIRHLAQWFEEGRTNYVQRDWVIGELNIDPEKYEPLIKKLEAHGIVENVQSTAGGVGVLFIISPYAVQVARQMDRAAEQAAAGQDIVGQLQARARRKPWMAGVIVVFLILALLVPLINSLWELMERISSAVRSH